jgi:hypothetical protein
MMYGKMMREIVFHLIRNPIILPSIILPLQPGTPGGAPGLQHDAQSVGPRRSSPVKRGWTQVRATGHLVNNMRMVYYL